MPACCSPITASDPCSPGFSIRTRSPIGSQPPSPTPPPSDDSFEECSMQEFTSRRRSSKLHSWARHIRKKISRGRSRPPDWHLLRLRARPTHHAIGIVWESENGILYPMSSAKQAVEQLLHRLPDDCSLEDVQYHLYVLEKVRHGLDDARRNGTLSQEQVEARLSQWLTE